MTKAKTIEILRWLLIFLIISTLLFIFGNSLATKEQSSAESGAVADIISEIFPPNTSFGKFLQDNLRKIAHFAEFFALGSEVTIYVIFFVEKKRQAFVRIAPLSFVVGFFDETLQYFSDRGPAIFDVWIDALGYLSAFVILLAIFYLVLYIKSKVKKEIGNG